MSFCVRLQPSVVDLRQPRIRVRPRFYKDGKVWGKVYSNQLTFSYSIEEGRYDDGPQLRTPSCLPSEVIERQRLLAEITGVQSLYVEGSCIQRMRSEEHLTNAFVDEKWSELHGSEYLVPRADGELTRLLLGLIGDQVEGQKVVQSLKLDERLKSLGWKITRVHLNGYQFETVGGEVLTCDDFLEDVYQQLSE